jgi:hypothetical protein
VPPPWQNATSLRPSPRDTFGPAARAQTRLERAATSPLVAMIDLRHGLFRIYWEGTARLGVHACRTSQFDDDVEAAG